MTPAEVRFFARARNRVRDMEPEMRAAILRAFQIIREALSEAELARLIDTGQLDLLFARVLSEDVLDRAMIPVRYRIRHNVEQSFKFATNDLPKGGTIDGVLAVAFDHLSPAVVTALRTLETTAITTLKADIRETVRAFAENALRDGIAPKAWAKKVREVIGLAPNQEQYVRNFRAALESGDVTKALSYKLRDKRFDASIKAGTMTPEKIDRMVTAYRKRFVAYNANTNAKAVTFDAYKAGQKLAWQDAKDQGVIPDGYRLMKQWKHLPGQKDPRPEHEALDGAVVPADEVYPNGDTFAGEGDPWNCHCLDRYFVEKAA